ncbi:MAG: regulatory protein RecX [Candidatus Omnitrophica bacterium]|nr:regulatory protein RecX [Candidatus Omnitrophota bacterium]
MDELEMLKKAKGYALRLFKLRPQSALELAQKLRLKGYGEEIVEKIVLDCKISGFVNDEEFAKAWLTSRLKKYGFRRVTLELERKGIGKEFIQKAWAETRNDYDEEALVRDIVARRVRVYQTIPPLKRKKRTMDYLIRRGFGLETINKVLREL